MFQLLKVATVAPEVAVVPVSVSVFGNAVLAWVIWTGYGCPVVATRRVPFCVSSVTLMTGCPLIVVVPFLASVPWLPSICWRTLPLFVNDSMLPRFGLDVFVFSHFPSSSFAPEEAPASCAKPALSWT